MPNNDNEQLQTTTRLSILKKDQPTEFEYQSNAIKMTPTMITRRFHKEMSPAFQRLFQKKNKQI